MAAAQNSGSNQPNASPGNDQGASAYGNNSYNAGAQARPPGKAKGFVVLAYATFPPQKAETNPQAPPAPQSNSGQSSAAPPPANSASNGSAPADSTNSAESDAAENAALQGRIQQALSNEPTLSTSHLSVHVTDSTIELSGTAASSRDKLTAERIAESFNGNRKFDDNKLLVIGQPPAAPATQPNSGSSPKDRR